MQSEKKISGAYLVFWFSQAVSQLGSSLTAFALVLWAYSVSHSAFSVSLMTFSNYFAYIVMSLFSGPFVDRNRKKNVMIAADVVAVCASVTTLILVSAGTLQLWHIYLVNAVIGAANAFQSPASAVAVRMLVPKEKLSNASGLTSFSENLNMIFAPVIAAAAFGVGGLKTVLIIDLVTFFFAFILLLFFIRIPGDEPGDAEVRISAFDGMRLGIEFLKKNHLMRTIILTMWLVNFFSRLTYENTLSPMILARTGEDSAALAAVNAAIGAAGVLGGIFISLDNKQRDPKKQLYYNLVLSFMFGDLVMAFSHSTLGWCLGGIGASLPIPAIHAAQSVITYREVPEEMQGRIIAVRNALQYSAIPVGLLFGGWIADNIFEPFMAGNAPLALSLQSIVGTGPGTGIAVMFLCTGTLGTLWSAFSYFKVKDL